MDNQNKTEQPWDVAKATRNVVVGTVESARMIRQRAIQLKQTAEKKYQESRPAQQKAKDAIKTGAEKVVHFGKEVGKGFQQGVTDVKAGESK